ncbi:MAG: hypothetical protein ABJA98_25840 [Acidobacteriota bacterium]
MDRRFLGLLMASTFLAALVLSARESRPWTLKHLPLDEYACHEGNCGLANILRGARVEERTAQ